ncbi:MAG TPA: extracellular solute-binding protein [Thermoanaerobaculia bacterium]|nr:extracellular solute-binding protein [Thermoanaerobaculia bacterium]
MRGIKHAGLLTLALAGLLLIGYGTRAAQGQPSPKGTLTVAIWSGPPATALQDFLTQFRKKYPDVNVKLLYQGGAGQTLARLRTEKARPTIDIFFSTESAAWFAANEELSVPITEDKVANLRNVKDDALAAGMHDGKVFWVPYWKGYVGIAVNTKVYDPKTITSWKWMWSKELAPRKLGVPANFWFSGGQIQQVAKIWGGNENKYEIAFEKLKELAPNVGLVYASDADSMKALISGETPAQLTLFDDVYRSVVEGAPLAVVVPPDAPVFAYYDVIVAVKNPPGGESLQMLFINELLTRDANQRWNNLIADEPTIKGATVDPKVKDYVGFANQWHPDVNVVVKNWTTWNERHKKEIEPLFGK